MKNKITKEDFILWEKITKNIQPIDNNSSKKDREFYDLKGLNSANNQQKQKLDSLSSEKTNKIIEKRSKSNLINNNKVSSSLKANTEDLFTGIHKRLDQKMTRGHVEIDASIDLHGLNQEQARLELNNFILRSKKNNFKIVLVITGKGNSPKTDSVYEVDNNQRGVLNKNLPLWLKKDEIRKNINGYRYASQKHGGQGAYYILLKSN
ncbi:MAG: Smr/MutS family protein [Hyphomicrobiales bacterium]